MIRSIIVVCTGNTCRSPMAAGFFRGYLSAGFIVSSAGVAAAVGAPANKLAVQVMSERYGIDISAHRAQQLTPGLAHGADLILGLTCEHVSHIQALYPQLEPQLITAYPGPAGSRGIPDPYRMPLEVYLACAASIAQEVQRICTQLDPAISHN